MTNHHRALDDEATIIERNELRALDDYARAGHKARGGETTRIEPRRCEFGLHPMHDYEAVYHHQGREGCLACVVMAQERDAARRAG